MLAVAATLLLAACGEDDSSGTPRVVTEPGGVVLIFPTTPTDEPVSEGVVLSAGPSSIVVRDGGDACGQSEFAPSSDVKVEREGDTIAWTDIREGDHVRVWTNGTQDDSCPSQAGALIVEVVG
jgi:hypothetical protein